MINFLSFIEREFANTIDSNSIIDIYVLRRLVSHDLLKILLYLNYMYIKLRIKLIMSLLDVKSLNGQL